ncbi:hypothetical protein LG275_03885 [Chryseomicrobium palamuruense]
MNIVLIKNFMHLVYRHSPNAFINPSFEVIIEPKNNIYFRLEDIETDLVLKCKVLAWLSRPSCKGVSDYWQKRMRNIFNESLGTDFTLNEIETIYTRLGNDINRNLSIKFIESNYDLSLLEKN